MLVHQSLFHFYIFFIHVKLLNTLLELEKYNILKLNNSLHILNNVSFYNKILNLLLRYIHETNGQPDEETDDVTNFNKETMLAPNSNVDRCFDIAVEAQPQEMPVRSQEQLVLAFNNIKFIWEQVQTYDRIKKELVSIRKDLMVSWHTSR